MKDIFIRGRDKPTNTNNVCTIPHNSLTIGITGGCFLCICEGWLPVSVGDILEFDSLEEIWENDIARSIQRDVADKKFTNCAVEACGIEHGNHFSRSYSITVNLDNSCNLACPSCRKGMINVTKGPLFELRLKKVNHFLNLLRKFNKPFKITMIGNGDPLASTILRPIVLNWEPKPNQKITLFTNGLLMKKLLPDSKILPSIDQFDISIDAGSPNVYKKVRYPGKFEILKENLDWLLENKSKDAKVLLKFTLSANNALDIENFVNFCHQYGFDGDITKLVDWKTFDRFEDQDVVGNLNHPLRDRALEGLRYAATKPWIRIGGGLEKLL